MSWTRSITLLMGLVAAVASAEAEAPPSRRVATVDGVPISAADLSDAAQELRGGVPGVGAAQLQSLALQRCVRDVVLEELAQSRGLFSDGGYAGRRDAFARENRRRSDAKARDQVVYGPVSFRWEQYVRWRRDQVQLALWHACQSDSPGLLHSQLKSRYDAWIASRIAAAQLKIEIPAS